MAAGAPVAAGNGASESAASYQREGLSLASRLCPAFSPANVMQVAHWLCKMKLVHSVSTVLVLLT